MSAQPKPPLKFKIKQLLYGYGKMWASWKCRLFGHKPGPWVTDFKALPWQIKMGIKIPKRMSVCSRCKLGLQEFEK